MVGAATLFVFLQLRPDLLLRNTTPNGGDTGAHVWWPAFLRDHVFPDLRLSGWAPDWYAGFPVGHFYFPLAAVLIDLLDLVLPYNIAFKLVTALGPTMLPAAAYAFARGLRVPWPAPPLFAAVTLPFLFFTGYTIYGGNLPSALAGEFSFSISLALALFFLAALAVALERGRRLWLPALLLALVVLSHLIVGIFAVVAAAVVWLARRPVRNLRPALAIGVVAALLTAIWALPMVARLAYSTDMGWGKLTEYRKNLVEDLRWAIVLGGVGLVAGAALARRAVFEVAALMAMFGLAFRFLPEGRLWNARLLPFYVLMLLFLAAMGVAEVLNLLRSLPGGRLRWWFAQTGGAAVDGVDPDDAPSGEVFDVVTDDPSLRPVLAERSLSGRWLTHVVAVVAVVVAIAYAFNTRDFIPGWVAWNNSGYESKPAWSEFQDVIHTVDQLPPGRLLWERLNAINTYGSDLALELLPYFTDGRIGSMEGLYFESSATTPYHFMTVAEIAKEPSNPVRGLPYGTLADFDRGVSHLRILGVRYLMLGSDEAKAKADANPSLRLVAETGSPNVQPKVARWRIYEVRPYALVEPMRYEPVVMTGVSPADWQEPAVQWFADVSQLDRVLAAGGPAGWARVPADESRRAPRRRLPPVTVDDFREGDETMSFHVSRTGVPVLVKTSYFPNWRADGARGPWRVTPNLMVVVPTEHQVVLRYERDPVDRLGIALSLLGVVGLAWLARWRPRTGRDEPPGTGIGEATTEPLPSTVAAAG